MRQHTSVDAGDFLRLLETHAGIHRVELTEIRRQTDYAYREAIRQMSAGAASVGLSRLDELGWLKEGGPDYLQNAATEYAEAIRGGGDKSRVICVAPTWAENHALTEVIRGKLKERDDLGAGKLIRTLDPLSWTTEEKRDASRYRPGLVVVYECNSGFFRKGEMATVVSSDESVVTVHSWRGGNRKLPLSRGNFDVCATRDIEVARGDRLLLRANDKEQGLINGKVVTVKSVQHHVIHTEDGLEIDSSRYARFTHGYVATSHKSQGMTADRVIVAAGRLDAKAAYVACSRGRSLCTVHTPDKVALLGSLPSGDRPLVVEKVALGSLIESPGPSLPEAVAIVAAPGPPSSAFAALGRVPGHGVSTHPSQSKGITHER